MVHSFKIVLVGDSKVGKTTYVQRLNGGYFEEKHIATMGVEVNPLVYTMKPNKNVVLNMWDCGFQQGFEGAKEGYWIGAHGVILMFDVTSRESYNNLEKHYSNLRKVLGDEVPIVLCGNKVDLEHESNEIIFQYEKAIPLFMISTKSTINYEKPILHLIRTLLGNEELSF